jgi:hypothetical protein
MSNTAVDIARIHTVSVSPVKKVEISTCLLHQGNLEVVNAFDKSLLTIELENW